MAMNFTPEQKKAIETLDKSVLVSAAAGSGKTAILVERILRIILDGRANVDELLVVTFTKAAAAEMKLRLASAIRKRMRENPEESQRLKDQLARLYRAYITTIDSFALRVLREFFYETDSEPDFRACDEVQGELMRRDALAELFEAGFEDDHFLDEGSVYAGEDACDAIRSVGFREFLRLYSEERQDESFKEKFLAAYTKLRTIPDYFEWAYDRAGNLRVSPETFEGSSLQETMTEDACNTLARACDAADRMRDVLDGAGLFDLYEEKLSPEVNALKDLREEIEDHGLTMESLDRFSSVSFATLRAKKSQKESYEAVKGEVKALRDAYKNEMSGWNKKYMLPDFATRLEEMNETYRYTVYYIRMLEEFERLYGDRKRERHVVDFADMEHSAVRILRKKETADIMRGRFKYIFVDEYQDTNRIQEELISSVARPDNVFRVGDIKQSIYKFRQAEPEIFRKAYMEFSDPGNDDGIAVDLGRNFRSNDATVRYINRVFGEIMEGYDERARLYTGTSCEPEYDFVPEMHLLLTDEEEPSDADEGSDDEIAELSKEEAEAEYIAGLVEKLIGTEYQDTKTHEVRRASAKDIVILFRAVRTRGDIMAAALRKHGIEPHVEESDDYFDTVEIGIAMSLLSCIDNMKRDVPLIAALHSEVFGWTPAELAEVRIAYSERRPESGGSESGGHSGRRAYWETLEWYRKHGPEGELRDKANYAADKILRWRSLSRMMPLDDFVWHVLVDSGYYRMAGAMNGGARRQANLRTLADRAAGFSRDTVASLSSFISFADVLRKKKISSSQTPAAAGDDVVRISTIHKSKGLEYPFVIVGGLGHRFRNDTNDKSFSFDPAIGVGLPYIDPARKYWRSTLVQRAVNAKSLRDSFSEELRVLYVAMTRARNKLIMVGTCESEAKLAEYTARPGSYLKVMRDVVKTAANTYHIAPLSGSSSAELKSARRIPDPDTIVLTPDERKLYEEVDRRFSYRYPDEELLVSKAKYSVSELRRQALEADAAAGEAESGKAEESAASEEKAAAEDITAKLRRRKKRAGVSAADVGTGYHRIMEFVDFARAVRDDGSVDETYIDERADLLRERGAIEERVFREIDTGRVADFFRSELGQRASRAAKSGSLRKEKPFTLRTVRPSDSEGAGSRPVLVQGVIDCCFEENGGMILLDYKSSYIRPDGGRAEIERIKHEYSVQIDLYAEAVRKGTGLEVKEAYLYLFSTGEAIAML